MAVSISGLPHTFAYYADFFNNATDDDMQEYGTGNFTLLLRVSSYRIELARIFHTILYFDILLYHPHSVIISADDPIIVPLLEAHVVRYSNRTRAVLVDVRAEAMRRRSADTCSTAVDGSATLNARAHVSPHNPDAINSSSLLQQPHQSAPVYLLTVLSTGFRQYLDLLINQQSIGRQHQPDDEGADFSIASDRQSPSYNSTALGEPGRRARQRSLRRRHRQRRQAIEIANEIKSTVDDDNKRHGRRRPQSSTDGGGGDAAVDMLRPVTNDTTAEWSPEIIARIKQFYGSSVAGNSTLSPSALSIYDYCQRFVSSGYHLDAITTAAVCDILLQDDTVSLQPQLSLADDDDGDDDGDNGDNNDPDADDDESSAAAAASPAAAAPTVVIHAAECQTAVKWFALFDFIIANVMDRSGSQTTTMATFGSTPEFSLLPYSTAEDGGWRWPPVLRVTAAAAVRTEAYGADGVRRSSPPFSSVSSSMSDAASYVNWVTDGLQMFWQCGVHCWTVTSLVVLTLLLTMGGCIVAAIAAR